MIIIDSRTLPSSTQLPPQSPLGSSCSREGTCLKIDWIQIRVGQRCCWLPILLSNLVARVKVSVKREMGGLLLLFNSRIGVSNQIEIDLWI